MFVYRWIQNGSLETEECTAKDSWRTCLLLHCGFRSVEDGDGDWPGEDSGPPTQLQGEKEKLKMDEHTPRPDTDTRVLAKQVNDTIL